MHLPDTRVVNFPIPSAPVIAVVEVLPHLLSSTLTSGVCASGKPRGGVYR